MSGAGEGLAIPARARLFPLSNVVLFPLGLLPLHIFEPRYRQMTADSLADDRAITMILPQPGATSEPVPLSAVGCLGRIHQEHRLEDGRFTFILRGEARVRLESEIPTDRLYRTAAITVLQDCWDPRWKSRRQLQRAHVLRAFRALVPGDHAFSKKLVEHLSGHCGSGPFTDIVAYAAPLDASLKQQLLEELNVDRRLEILADEMPLLAQKMGAEEGGSEPEASRN